jgi:hypothetical protein
MKKQTHAKQTKRLAIDKCAVRPLAPTALPAVVGGVVANDLGPE